MNRRNFFSTLWAAVVVYFTPKLTTILSAAPLDSPTVVPVLVPEFAPAEMIPSTMVWDFATGMYTRYCEGRDGEKVILERYVFQCAPICPRRL